jgi:hypothetical protein
LGDDAYASPDNQLMVLNQETQSWEPVAKIHTMEELLAQVPSEQEMMDFLKSDEIIRATRNYKEAPLGVGPQINNERFGNMESQLDTIIWRSPQLVWLDLVNGEKIIAQVLPVVGTAGTNNLSRPVFLYLIIGKERESVAGFSINGTRGGSNYVVEVEKFSKVFLRGHQISNRVVYGFWDHEKEDEFRESNYPQGILHELILDTFGTETAKALNRLRNGQSVDDGTFIGFNLTFIPGTTISDKGLTSPDF